MKSSSELIASQDRLSPVVSSSNLEISATLVNARRKAIALSGFPGKLPADLDTAYQIQSHSTGKWPDKVAGWKVGGIPEKWQQRLGSSWLMGPIFSESVKHHLSGDRTAMPVYKNGFAAIEPELIVMLGETRAKDRIFTGVEIASSPIPAINDHGPVAVVCDFGNNNGVLLGQEIGGWADLRDPIETTIWIDGKLIGEKVLTPPFKAARSALTFCLETAKRRKIELPPGTLISSGAITGVHEAQLGAHSLISFGSLGRIELELGCATPIC